MQFFLEFSGYSSKVPFIIHDGSIPLGTPF